MTQTLKKDIIFLALSNQARKGTSEAVTDACGENRACLGKPVRRSKAGRKDVSPKGETR